ncbi:MAG TPA: cytochrome c oxidase subunit 3 [Verrucomicrobiae bacterium]|nr:cytochrome c oxidase subunit 3 [Verrucomicrobiae bacterium]
MPVIADAAPSDVRSPKLGGSGHNGSRNLVPDGGSLRRVHDNAPPPGSTAIWVGIAAICMMFAAFTSAMVVRQGAGMDWQHINLPNILFFNTVVLLGSSVTLELFRRRFVSASAYSDSAAFWLYSTLGLGMIFVAGQYIAWRQLNQEGVYLASNPSSSFFYVLTATHAVHVIGGLGGLLYVIGKLRKLTLRKTTLDVAAKYWHFMDVLWLYLLGLLWMKM